MTPNKRCVEQEKIDSKSVTDSTSDIVVSIYCLTYNHEAYIADCLNGFLKQKTKYKYEIIVHDDASSDRTPQIVRDFADKYPDIIVPIYQKENQYSKGIKITSTYIRPLMRGKYIACCEGDDYWTDENKLEKQIDFLESHSEYSACVHNTLVIDQKHKREYLINKRNDDYDVKFDDVIVRGANVYQTSSLVYKLDLFDERPDFITKTRGFGDWPLAIYLTLCGKVRYLADTMSVYRASTLGSWTLRTTSKRDKYLRNEVGISHCKQVLNMFDMVDDYTENQFAEQVENARKFTRYELLGYSGKYIDMLKPKYWAEFKKLSNWEKLKIVYYSILQISLIWRK